MDAKAGADDWLFETVTRPILYSMLHIKRRGVKSLAQHETAMANSVYRGTAEHSKSCV